MDPEARYELYLIKRELTRIINELENISYGVRRDFKNVGNNKCADSISRSADKYRTVRRKLDNIDTETVYEGHPNYGGGGRSGGGGSSRSF